MYESQHQQAQQQDDKHHHHHHFQQQLIQATQQQQQQPEPNTYDYASQLMFDANSFASMNSHHHHAMDLNSAATVAANVAAQQQQQQQSQAQQGVQGSSYLDFLPTTNSSNNDPYEMFRYQTVNNDYTSAKYQQQQQQATYPMMAFHTTMSQDHLSSDYPIPYDHHHNHNHHHPYMFHQNGGGPMPTLSTSSSSSSSLSSTNTASTAYGNDNRGAQVYVRKACVSCKQSHVACDVQRPCARCVRLNKADTCVDAERKKRGRPCGSSKKKKEALVLNATAAAANALTAANMMSYL